MEAVASTPWYYADCKPSDRLITAIFESSIVRQESHKALDLLNALLQSQKVSPRRLTGGFNNITCGLALDRGDVGSTTQDVVRLLDQMFKLQVDVYYETFNLIAQRFREEGLDEQAEMVMQRRSSMYHSSD